MNAGYYQLPIHRTTDILISQLFDNILAANLYFLPHNIWKLYKLKLWMSVKHIVTVSLKAFQAHVRQIVVLKWRRWRWDNPPRKMYTQWHPPTVSCQSVTSIIAFKTSQTAWLQNPIKPITTSQLTRSNFTPHEKSVFTTEHRRLHMSLHSDNRFKSWCQWNDSIIW